MLGGKCEERETEADGLCGRELREHRWGHGRGRKRNTRTSEGYSNPPRSRQGISHSPMLLQSLGR